VKKFSGLILCCAVMLLALQGCSTTASTGTARPAVIEKGRPAPVARDRPAPVAPPREQFETPAVAPQPPAVLALLEHAEQQANAGDLGSAAASLERAIRINPGNAVLWYHLATVRLAQGEALQAEQLAVKSSSLAPGNTTQQARNWKLIAAARRQRSDLKGANAAEQRARELERR
jgi:Flp pilus assembly protein TadD